MKKTYWAVRFGDDNTRAYRVTTHKYLTEKEAATEVYGMHATRMRCARFTRNWRNLTVAQKLAVEKELGL